MTYQADPIYELRFYNVEKGRDADMKDRVKNDWPEIFQRHKIKPIGCWSAVAADSLPKFVYIMPWESMAQRNQHWAGFYSDPQWHEVRERTNAGSELVEDYEIFFLKAHGTWDPVKTNPEHLDEVIFHRAMVGKAIQVKESMLNTEIPAFVRAGAHSFSSFDVLSGRALPAVINFLRWNSMEDKLAAIESIENDNELKLSRKNEVSKFGSRLLGRSSSYLLKPLDIDWA